MDDLYLQSEYIPRNNSCQMVMDPFTPEGCQPGYEPYVHRTKEMLQSSDEFIPCCKKIYCDSKSDCKLQADMRWTKRVLRFADSARTLCNILMEDVANIERFTKYYQLKLNIAFQQDPESHKQATEKLQQFYHVATVVHRDLDRCVKAMTIVVDEGADARPKPSVVPLGRDFDAMRAEAVGTGCASL